MVSVGNTALEIMDPERHPRSSCWKRRTVMERSLIGTLIIAIIVIICLGVVVALTKKHHSLRPHCQTDICIKEAAVLISSMNTTIDPCDDFYEFACGRYIQEAEIPDDKTDIDPLNRIGDLIISQLKTVITQPSLPTDIEPYVMLRKMYTTCMDISAIEESGLDQMYLLLKKLGGWPVLQMDSWVEIDWINITQRLRHYGFNTHQFIAIDIDVNAQNSTEYVVSIDEWKNDEISESNLKRGLEDDLVASYSNFLIELSVLFGAEREFATREVEDVIEFRANLSKFIVSKSEHYKLLTHANVTTIGELQVLYPSIPWLDVINVALAIPNVTLNNQARVAVISPSFISEFEQIINETPKRVQVNHALFEIIRSRINCLPRVIRKTEQQFLAYATGVTRSPHRSRTCIDMTTNDFHVAVDALYIRKYGNDEAKEDVTEIVSNIKHVFVSRLKKVEWMDNGTKATAVEKAEMITAHIAYSVELRNESNVVEYYKGLEFDSESILELIIQISKFKRDKLMSLYKNPVVKNHWTLRVPAITSNAFYDPQENSIQIPSGIMQKEFYTYGRPKFMNYGGLGFVVAHEITHGFDSDGKWFNKMGDVSNWWNKSTDDAYGLKAQCFVEQYSNYSIPGSNLHLDGENTLAENIADNGGVKDAYLAYLAWIRTHEPELPLPGLNLTDKQLFWISLANSWCAKSRQSSLEQTVLGDEHAPDRFRIMGSLSNTQYFARDFNCPLGSNMNPVKKCQIW